MKFISNLLKLFLLILLAQPFGPVNPAEALTAKQREQLLQTGLSLKTIELLSDLEQDPKRATKPRLTFKAVKKMAEDGLNEEIIQLLIHLDRVSAIENRMTVSPGAVSALKKAGVSDASIRLMLESEIRIAQGQAPQDMGRWTITNPDGSRTIVYSVGDPTKPLPSLSQRQEEELKKALEILKHLNITIEYPSVEKPR
ncbi:MAG: hypothetical protein JRI34_02885 [Deltaproteobacteria bacterium]|nr:hypothetical protein [Deltaproteobacteria bacterium]